jgi:ribosome biogenesis GTPase A
MSTPLIQWYPGHIAKAEKALQEQLKLVDVVLEVRDARIPLSTKHPKLDHWLGNKARLLVLNRLDMIPDAIEAQWCDWFKLQNERVYYTDAKQGKGISILLNAAQTAGNDMNERRKQRDMKPRPVRSVVIGFPNVGKSALINRLLKRRIVDSARRPGVTRQLRWVRISDEIELLDSPGIIPVQLEDQHAALKLAICEDIGEAAYDTQRVAAGFIDLLQTLDTQNPNLNQLPNLAQRYGIDPHSGSGESYLESVGLHNYQGDRERAARQILNDFRKGNLGKLVLELPPVMKF